jgi:anti-anti-sigma factor
MCRNEEHFGPARQIDHSGESMRVVMSPCSPHVCILYLEGPLRLPLDEQLRHRVRALLGRGERTIVLDLARVSRIDAAGVGELVHAYNMTIAVNGVLRIAYPTAWVREILDRAGLFDLLSADPESDLKDRPSGAFPGGHTSSRRRRGSGSMAAEVLKDTGTPGTRHGPLSMPLRKASAVRVSRSIASYGCM